MQNATVTVAKVVKTHSKLGNPAFSIVGVNEFGLGFAGKTRANAGFVYALENIQPGDKLAIVYKLARGGKSYSIEGIARA